MYIVCGTVFEIILLKSVLGQNMNAGFIHLICCHKLCTNALKTSVKPLPVSYLRLVFIEVLHGLYTQFHESDFKFVGALLVSIFFTIIETS